MCWLTVCENSCNDTDIDKGCIDVLRTRTTHQWHTINIICWRWENLSLQYIIIVCLIASVVQGILYIPTLAVTAGSMQYNVYITPYIVFRDVTPYIVFTMGRCHTWQSIWESVFVDVFLSLGSSEVTPLLCTQIIQNLVTE